MVNRRDNKMKIMKPVPDYHDDKEIISGSFSMIFFRYLLINLVLIALSVGRAKVRRGFRASDAGHQIEAE